MKNLLVMRHAKSDWSHEGMEDFDRPLNRRGRKDVPRVARFLAGAGPPELVLSSSAVRAHETAIGLVEASDDDPQLVLDGRLYGAGPQILSEVLAAAAGGVDTVLLVAHNPGLEDWIAELTGASLRLPTASVARIDFDTDTWDGFGQQRGQLQWLVTPKLLKAGAAAKD